MNGTLVGEHLGGHLPFAPEITAQLAWDRPNVIAISVENKQLPDRVPAGNAGTPGLLSGLFGGVPETTYDFFPYAGIHRPVVLCALPQVHVEDVAVETTIDGKDGVVKVTVTASGAFTGTGSARLGETDASARVQERNGGGVDSRARGALLEPARPAPLPAHGDARRDGEGIEDGEGCSTATRSRSGSGPSR